jgi:hypothetical protein
VIITSGLLRAIQDRGFDKVSDMRVTSRVLPATQYVAGFGFGAGSIIGSTSQPILFPEIHFYTNEDWAVVHGLADGRGVPIVLMDHYGRGELYVLAVPESMNALYRLPTAVLNDIRESLAPGLRVRLEGPAKVSLFLYDNGSFVVESFLDHPAAVRITGAFGRIQNISSGTTLTGEPLRTFGFGRPGAARQFGFEIQVEPHSLVAFREQP